MKRDLMLAIRIDDVPDNPNVKQVENLAKVIEKHKAKPTLAVCSGWLRDWVNVQPTLKRIYDEGLADIACHGVYHEDFGGIGTIGKYGGKDHYFRPLSLPETHVVLGECQSFAKKFFGDTYKVFITPGSNSTGNLLPREINTFYEILRINGFKAIGHYPGICGVDPLARVAKRTPHICEIPFTVYVDFFRRGYFKNLYRPADYEGYVEATKAYIKTRFDLGLFVCLFLHMINFLERPIPESGYPGGNPGGSYLDTILGWVKEKYPKVRFVGMTDLIDLAEA